MGNQHSLVQQSPAKRSYLQIQVDQTESDKITAAIFFFCPCKRPFPSSSESVQQTRVDQSGIAREYQKIRWSERILDDPSLDRTVLSAASPQWLHKNRLCRWSSAGQKRSMIPSRSFMSESVTQMLTKKDPLTEQQPKVWFPKPFFGNLKTPHITTIIINITTIIVINITTIMVIIIMVIISKVKGPYMASRGRGLIFSYEGEREWSKRTLRPIITS